MGIQPIDLQALFTQVDKVGKTLAFQREGLQLQQSIQNLQIQKKTDERARSVNESQSAGGVDRVKDRNADRHEGESPAHDNKKKERSGVDAPDDQEEFQDPLLGKNIDFSG
ncbi:MAG: hypothetical protein LBG76_09880 [Treponema sp.]|jgi:hypothetical protein|nr:hypothetical protein [Treponema sp.]